MRRIFPLPGRFLLLLASCPRRRWGRRARCSSPANATFFSLPPDLGNSVSGNLHIVGSALVGAGLNLGSLSIEDGARHRHRPAPLQSAVGATHSATRTTPDPPSSACAPTACSLLGRRARFYLMLGDGRRRSAAGRGGAAKTSFRRIQVAKSC
ncbi:MAG: hypothetical protein ACLVB5_03305 [Christensenellales bacterium]